MIVRGRLHSGNYTGVIVKSHTYEHYHKGSPIVSSVRLQRCPRNLPYSPVPSHIFWWSQLAGRHTRTLRMHHIGFVADTERRPCFTLRLENENQHQSTLITSWEFVVHGPADRCRSKDSTVALADTWWSPNRSMAGRLDSALDTANIADKVFHAVSRNQEERFFSSRTSK